MTTETFLPAKITRPVLRYYGGKWKMAQWIVSNFPPHRIYTEGFGGGASVMLRKKRCAIEVYNDLDAEVVNLFRVLRDPAQAKDLTNLLHFTPFARDEFALAYQKGADDIERARRLVVRSFLGHSSIGATRDQKTGFRRDGLKRGKPPTNDWVNYPACLAAVTERLRGVIVENLPATEVLKAHDHPEALHYVDPPYPMSTRRYVAENYRHEMTDDDHRALAQVLKELQGMVIVSGYPCPLYDKELFPLSSGWTRLTKTSRTARGEGGGTRTEVIWLSPSAAQAIQRGLDF